MMCVISWGNVAVIFMVAVIVVSFMVGAAYKIDDTDYDG